MVISTYSQCMKTCHVEDENEFHTNRRCEGRLSFEGGKQGSLADF